MMRTLTRLTAATAVVLAVFLTLTGQAGANPAPTITQTADCVDVTFTVKNNVANQTIGIKIDGGQQINIPAGQTRTLHAAFGSTHTVQWGYASGAGGTITVTAASQPQSCTTTTTAAPTTTVAPTTTAAPVTTTPAPTTAAPTTVVESTTVASSPTTAAVKAAAAHPDELPPSGYGGPLAPLAVVLAVVGGVGILVATRRPAVKGN